MKLADLTEPTNNIRWQDVTQAYRYIDLTSVDMDTKAILGASLITSANAPSRAQKLVISDDVIFATTRPTQMRSCIIPAEHDGSVASTGYCVLRAKKEIVLPKWIFYNTSKTSFKDYIEKNQSGSAYPAISDAKLKEFLIPVPSLEEQARIVAILDKFDTLTHSIIEGLPREIELRQKQYAYYRDLLFNFPQPA